ncbi:T6SS immunity protein Tli4 family protein [Luteimonas abyssi]|uniref:T6SS immunity protein Tli4 family protein n=1 Tax=Luteimonas abyssi TaxID=1247514 RepID=UPI00138F9528|nr:T6SS immunity protein Tli4 family protein [Luteimonas abyssi]
MAPIEPMRTECFGRHEISMPESFRFRHSGSSVTFYYRHDTDFETVEAQVVDSDAAYERFVASVASRAADISAESNEKTGGSMLLAQEEIESNTLLLRYHRSDVSDRSHVHEVHRLVSGKHLFLKADSFKGEWASVEARLKQLAAGARAISPAAGPIGGDFCLGGLVLDPVDDYESAKFSYRAGNLAHRDVVLAIESETFKRDEAAARVVQRLDGNFSGLGLRPVVLRKGAFEFGGAPAEQWLGREQVDGQVEHLFVAESYPASPGLRSPALQVELRTGGVPSSQPDAGLPPYRRPTMPPTTGQARMASSLSDDQAIALWDEMVQSIKAR